MESVLGISFFESLKKFDFFGEKYSLKDPK